MPPPTPSLVSGAGDGPGPHRLRARETAQCAGTDPPWKSAGGDWGPGTDVEEKARARRGGTKGNIRAAPRPRGP